MASKRDTNQLTIKGNPTDSEAKLLAQTALRPTVQAASTLQQYGEGTFGHLDIGELVSALTEQTQASIDGDLGRAEAMLTAQAHTLDAIFNILARRAALNMGEYLEAADRYIKLALKAQSQCRSTWETLGAIKNPPMVGYAKQANISQGHQQVNNGSSTTTESQASARENSELQNKLLEKTDAKRLDSRATRTAVGVNQTMAAVGEVDGTEDSIGQS